MRRKERWRAPNRFRPCTKTAACTTRAAFRRWRISSANTTAPASRPTVWMRWSGLWRSYSRRSASTSPCRACASEFHAQGAEYAEEKVSREPRSSFRSHAEDAEEKASRGAAEYAEERVSRGGRRVRRSTQRKEFHVEDAENADGGLP